MLRCYYDGSGKIEDSAVITLTGVIASESVWDRFAREWQNALDRHHAPVLHMTDAMALREDFSHQAGWTDAKVDALLLDLWGVVGKFRWNMPQTNLIAASCSVVMSDYWRAKQKISNLPEPEAICVNYCFNVLPHDMRGIWKWLITLGAPGRN